MFPTILQRAIFRELALAFLLALLALLAILLMVALFDSRWQTCMDLVSFLRVIQWLVPSLLPQTVPAALLFATCQVYGRMRRDQEALAVCAGGVHLFHTAIPALVLAVLLSAVIMLLNDRVIPSAEFRTCQALMRNAEGVLYAKLDRVGRVSVPPYTIYAREVQGVKLLDPVVKRVDGNKNYDLVMHARSGELRVDTACKVLRLRLIDGAMRTGGTRTVWEASIWNIPLPDCFGIYFPQRTSEMTGSELIDRRSELYDRMGTLESNGSELTPEQVETERASLCREVRYLDVEIQKRPAVAVGCLCFALAGCAAGLYAGFGDNLSAFAACFLPITVMHEASMACGVHLAVRCGWPPELTLWFTDAVIGLGGLAVFCRVIRR